MSKEKSPKKEKVEEEHSYFRDKKSKCQTFKETLWNPETKEFFGRNGKNWCLLFIFYVIYYAILAGFFCAALYVFLTTMITDDKPRLTGRQSILRAVPGLAHRSQIKIGSGLLNLNSKPPYHNDTKLYLKVMKKLMDTYPDSPANFSENAWDCSRSDPTLEKSYNIEKHVCGFSQNVLKECQNYEKQLNQGQPCLLFRMNKIYGWLPSFTNDSTIPYALVQCKGQNPADVENLGKIRYYPEYTHPKTGEKYGMISSNYFPYLGQNNYMSPVVAVQLRSVEKHVLILMTCQLSGIDEENEPMRMEFLLD